MRGVMWLREFDRREVEGALFAPLVVPGFLLFISWDGGFEAIAQSVEIYVYTTLISYCGMFLVGVPSIILLKLLRIESWYWYMFGGALTGGLLMYFIGNQWQALALAFNPKGSTENIEYLGAFFGGSVGLCYAIYTEEWTLI